MNVNKRIQAANEIAERILGEYGEQILGIAAYGSLAKGEDTQFSDLELWIATSGDMPSREVLGIYKGISVELYYGPADEFIEDARQVSPYWPVRADMRRSYLVLYERDDFFERVRKAASELKDEDFIAAAKLLLLRTRELEGKLRSARSRDDAYGVLAVARQMVFNFALLIGLVNRSYYPSQRGMYQLSKEMPLKPTRYPELLDAAGGFTTTEPREVYTAAIELWSDFQRFVTQLGIQWEVDGLVI